MTAEEFETAYAARSGASVDQLHSYGRYAKPCDCGEPGCEGWAMGHQQTVMEDRLNWLIRHQVCTRTGFAGEIAGAPCPDCGHSNVAHIGLDACVICELRAELADLRASH